MFFFYSMRSVITLFRSDIASFILDIDECSKDPSVCDKNADCINSDGSYSCSCKQGFTGDGKTCQGTFHLEDAPF